MSKDEIQIPEWYENKCREYVQNIYPTIYKNKHLDLDDGFGFDFKCENCNSVTEAHMELEFFESEDDERDAEVDDDY